MIYVSSALVDSIRAVPLLGIYVMAWDGELAVFASEPVPGTVMKNQLTAPTCHIVVGPQLSDDWLDDKSGKLREVRTQVRIYAPKTIYSAQIPDLLAGSITDSLNRVPSAVTVFGSTVIALDASGAFWNDSEKWYGRSVSLRLLMTKN